MPKTAEEKAADKAAKEAKKAAEASLKDLQKRAKKLGIEFDKDSTEAELKVLVEAGEAAAKAREDKADKNAGEADKPGTPEDRMKDEPPVNPEPKVGSVSDAKHEEIEGGTGKEELVQTLKTKQGHVFSLVISPDGDVQLTKVPNIFVQSFGPVSDPKSLEAGKKHMENLSRF